MNRTFGYRVIMYPYRSFACLRLISSALLIYLLLFTSFFAIGDCFEVSSTFCSYPYYVSNIDGILPNALSTLAVPVYKSPERNEANTLVIAGTT